MNEFLSRWTMQVCTIVFSQTAFTASGRPFSPSQTSMHTSRVPRFLISASTRSQNLAPSPSPCSPAHRPSTSRSPVHGDAQGQVDRPVRDLALPDLDVNSINEHDGVDRVERPALPFRHAVHHPVGDRADRLLRHLRAVNLGQVRGDLPVGQPFRGQGNHHLVDPGQPPLPFRDNLRLETGIAVTRHGDFHRPRIGENPLGPVAVAGIAAITPGRVVLAIAEMVIQLAFQRALDHHLRQLAQQAAVAGQLQPASAGPLGKLPQQLLIGSRELRTTLVLTRSSRLSLVSPPSRGLHR